MNTFIHVENCQVPTKVSMQVSLLNGKLKTVAESKERHFNLFGVEDREVVAAAIPCEKGLFSAIFLVFFDWPEGSEPALTEIFEMSPTIEDPCGKEKVVAPGYPLSWDGNASVRIRERLRSAPGGRVL